MLRFISTMLLAAIAVPALAAPPQPVMMTRDGFHYQYTSQLKGKLIAIRGEDLDNREAINLLVDSEGRVDGTVGGSHVSFNVPKESRDRIVATLIAAPATDSQLATIR